MNNTKILQFLLNNKDESFTIRNISQKTNINYRITHQTIKSLEQEGIIQTKSAGKALLCSLTNKFNEKVYLAEHQRRKDINLQQIITRYEQAKQTYILLLFGSYAKKTNTKHSDIDLLAITNEPEEIEEITKLIPKNIHLTTLTYKEFLQMKQSKETTVVSEVMKNNIPLINIEEYYRLINNE